jgi:acetyl esterase/lipase
MIRCFLSFLLIVFGIQGFAQQAAKHPMIVTYKKVDTTVLQMEVLYPPDLVEGRRYKCIAFFFGGGWINGSITQFKGQAEYLAKKGMVCFLVDYRTKSRHATTPFESLKDAKSAIRFIRKNADRFHIHKDSIVASGGSAGGHLAAATALVQDYNEATDDLSTSPKPNALVLFNPVIDNGPGGYGFERIGNEYKSFSPLHNIQKDAPPSIIFLGTNDNLVPVETANYFKVVMQKVGSRCDLILYKGEKHGFFNKKENAEKTLLEADKFLTSLGYLEP